MSGSRGRLKWYSDWVYVPKLRHLEQMPLQTTLDGVKHIFEENGVNPWAIKHELEALDQGGTFPCNRGLFISVHKRTLTITERLRLIAQRLHSPECHYNSCWWHERSGVVWWSYSREDMGILLRSGKHCANFGEIMHKFKQCKEVQDVRIECEAIPDTRRDASWVEVYPTRI